jgi:hypothetical protein
MEEHKHHLMGGLADPCVFEDLGGWVGLVENTQGPSRAHLNFLSAILGHIIIASLSEPISMRFLSSE